MDKKNTSVFNVLLSSSVPINVTGEENSRDFTNMDLAMKLHYLRSVYFFSPEAVAALPDFPDFKDPSLSWLNVFYETCGRLRRRKGEDERVFLKCNDGGIRFIEAQCRMTVEEWLEGSNNNTDSELIRGEALGPSLFFSPFVYLQVTRFKCGGVSLGLSWAHIMGDAFSTIDYMNMYGRFLSGQRPTHNLKQPEITSQLKSCHIPNAKIPKKPLSLKRVDPVGDNWIVPISHSLKMDTHTFHVTGEHLRRLRQLSNNDYNNINGFDIICALVWKSLGVRFVTICKQFEEDNFGNAQRIGTLEADFSEVGLSDLVELICSNVDDETDIISKTMDAKVDFVVYGANLTFVDMEEAGFYEMEINGHEPLFVDFNVVGVGEEGVVLVLPTPHNKSLDGGGGGGLMVKVTLPANRLAKLKRELEIHWGIL